MLMEAPLYTFERKILRFCQLLSDSADFNDGRKKEKQLELAFYSSKDFLM